jgi:calmodulin
MPLTGESAKGSAMLSFDDAEEPESPPPLSPEKSVELTDKQKALKREQEARNLMEITGANMQEILEYREIFELVDTDKGGSIDASELRKLVDLMNMDTSEDELDEMMQEIDTTGEGEIFFPDFVRCMLTKPTIDYTVADIHEAFAALAGPTHPSGFIPLKLLEDQLMNIGYESEKIGKERVEEILGLVEVDNAGMHNYGEFVSLMMGEAEHAKKSAP